MKKMHKSAILALPLVSFNIPALTNWVTRPERKMKESLKNAREHFSGEILEKELAERKASHQKTVDAQPRTVGELIKAYTYRYVHARTHTDYGVNGLGKESIAKLKQKLVELGLTPDDWPALVPHDEILVHLSKTAILMVPAKEIFPTLEEYERQGYTRCVGWTDEEAGTKTVRDLIQFDPLNISEEAPNINPRRWFESRKRFFIALRQQLVKKGFSSKDGKFFNWNPTIPALKKAQAMLRKHDLTPSEVRKFAKVLVAERLIV